MSFSRREFIKCVSAAAAYGGLVQLPARELWGLAPGEILPKPDEAKLRAIAFAAVEAARGAGADFADVRVTGMRRFGWNAAFDRPRRQRPTMSTPNLAFTTGYGVRALVDGAWGFTGSQSLTPDAIADAARTAVTRARANRPRLRRRIELAPVPRVEDGRWEPPIEEDPFMIPVGDQADLALTALTAAEGVWGVIRCSSNGGWSETLNVFASSEGSLIVQRLTQGGAGSLAWGRSQDDHVVATARPPSLRSGWYGYEALSRVDLVAELREAAARAVASSRPQVESNPVPVEVGRYDLVLSGWAVAHVMEATLMEALNLERALGYRANQEGTSFAAPPMEVLGKLQVGSPLVTLLADRTRPHAGASVGWDDEGVPTGEHTLVHEGVVVDYLSSRQTAAELAPAYQARGESVRSHGHMRGSGERRPEITLPNFTFLPGKEDVSAADLIAETRRGFYISGGAPGGSDQQLLSGQFVGGGVMEIRNGKLGRPVKDFAFQILTPQFWKNVDAVGGPSTVTEGGVGRNEGLIAQHRYSHSARGAAARIREVNVLNTGITL